MTTYNVVNTPARHVKPGNVIEISQTFGPSRLAVVTHSYVWTTGTTRIIEYTDAEAHDAATVSEDQMIPVLVRES